MLIHQASRWLLLATLTLVLGCGGDDAPAPARGEADVRRLLSLPYAGSSRAADDDTAGVIRHDPARTAPGYRLTTFQRLGRAELMEADGTVVNTWSRRQGDRWYRSVLLPGGDLLVVGDDTEVATGRLDTFSVRDDSRYLLRLDWSGSIVWERRLPVHHDVMPLPDGGFLALGYERRLEPELDPAVPVRDDLVLVLDDDGRVVDTISCFDAYRAADPDHEFVAADPTSPGGEPWLDLFHANAIKLLPRPFHGERNALVCFRHQHEIAVIDLDARTVVWRWGRDELQGPHDARPLPNGNIQVFDNGVARGWSRVVEVDPSTGAIVWEHRADPPRSFFTLSKGSSQRLDNGNTVFAESDEGRAFEIAPDGDVVWEYLSPRFVRAGRRAAIVRMEVYPSVMVERIRDLHQREADAP